MLDGLPIQGYCSMNMDGISVITDFVGGIQLTIPDDSLADVNPEYKKGAVVDMLTGETAEQFVRYRDIDKDPECSGPSGETENLSSGTGAEGTGKSRQRTPDL